MNSRTDRTQAAIVKELRARYYSVLVVSHLHLGYDIDVGWQGVNYKFEIKNADDSPSKKKLTKNEQEFKDTWRGQIGTIESVKEIISIITARF